MHWPSRVSSPHKIIPESRAPISVTLRRRRRHISNMKASLLFVTFALALCASARSTQSEDLLNASKGGHLEAIQALVDAGADVSTGAPFNPQISPLMVAAEEGQQEAVKLLISLGADIDGMLPSFRVRSPLHRAVANNHNEIVKILINEGADVDVPTGVFSRPLQEAAKFGNQAALKLLLDAGADVNAFDRFGNTALHNAAEFGQEAIVQLLIRAGADVTFTNRSQQAPLHFAAANGNINVIRELIDAGADVNLRMAGENRPIHLAAENGNFEAVKMLLENGADLEIKKSGGLTAFDLAAAVDTKDGRETVKILRERGAKTDGIDNYLLSKAGERDLGAIKALIEAGADVNVAQEFGGQTPLIIIAPFGSVELLQVLLANDANTCLKDEEGNTAFDVYCTFGFPSPEDCRKENPIPDNLKCV